jgi:hypothetical protein
MNWRILIFAALTSVGCSFVAQPGCAQDDPATAPSDSAPKPAPPAIATAVSEDFPQVTCTSADALACADTLQLATDTRDRLASLLQLGPNWRFAVHIHIMTPDDPLLAKVNREASAVFSEGNSIKIEAVLPSTDPDAREFIQRQFVTAILWEKFFANTTSFDKQTRLDVVPFWLVEGLREWVNDDPAHDRESIVKRAVQSQSAPTLEEVTGWHELSDDRLLGLWQRAFCFYLVDSITEEGARRADFQQWLAGFATPGSSAAQFHFPTESEWQHELVDASDRSRDVVYSWDETLSELTAAENITFLSPDGSKVQNATIDEAASLPRNQMVLEALQERIYLLTALELRAHPSWNPILELYRSGLSALVKDNHPDEAQKLLLEAQREQIVETDYHQKLVDYMNWFEVTKNYSNASHFDDYFMTAKEMEQVQGDPAHPNPIRANLLEIESEL